MGWMMDGMECWDDDWDGCVYVCVWLSVSVAV